MTNLNKSRVALLAASICLITSSACSGPDHTTGDWVEMSDKKFAEAFADAAFSDDLKDRELVAWLLF